MNWEYYNPKFDYEELFHDCGWPWAGHKFFAYDLVRNIKPKTIVELGTYKGTSLFSFCQAVKDGNLETEINAVDTWKGDIQSGFYDETVLEGVNKIKRKLYSEQNIKLLRMTFDEAVERFENKSIDILHIDGLHTYEAVKHDFETWKNKISTDGIVILHDIKVRENDFGVYKLWDELREKYCGIEFFHSFGLGIVFFNLKTKKDILALENKWQMHYSYIYEINKNQHIFHLEEDIDKINREIEYNKNKIINQADIIQQKDHEIVNLNQAVQQKDLVISHLGDNLQQKDREIIILGDTLRQKNQEVGKLINVLRQNDEKIADLESLVQQKSQEINVRNEIIREKDKELDFMKSSKFWRLREKYIKIKSKIKFAVFTPDKFIIKYFNKIKYLIKSFRNSCEEEDFRKALIRSLNYLRHGKGFLDYSKKLSVKNEVAKDLSSEIEIINTIKHYSNNRPTITSFVPFDFLPKNFGGGVRIMNVYGGLSEYFNINLVGIIGPGKKLEKYEINDNFTVYRVPMSEAFYDLLIKEQKNSGGSLHDILITNEYKLLTELCQLCKFLSRKSDVVISSHPYFFKMLLEFCSDKILVYEAHNVDYDLKKTYFNNIENNLYAQKYLAIVKEIETLACQNSDFILGVSGADIERLCDLYEVDKKKTIIVPNGIDVFSCSFIYNRDCKTTKKEKGKRVIFVGSAHAPNIEAVNYILQKLAPKNKDIHYIIIGNIKSSFNAEKVPQNVKFTGIVDERFKEELYKNCDLAINPMFSGSGTNLKVLEYIAYGIPLVSTKFGMRGLEIFNDHVYIADKNNFIEIVEKVLSLPIDILENNSRSARNICEKYFDKSIIILDFVKKIKIFNKKHSEKKRINIAIDGRILHRNVSGSERYISELVKNISNIEKNSKYNYLLVNNTNYKTFSVANIPCISSEDRIDLFHKTYQISSYNELLELLFADKSIFTFLDLILCKYPDYFSKKESHENHVTFMKLALNFSDRVIAISEHAKKDVIKTFGIPEEKIDVVYLGLDFNKFKKINDGREISKFRKEFGLPEKYILYIGTDYPHKNMKNLFLAFSEIMHCEKMRDYYLVLAGNNYYNKGQEYLKKYLEPIKNRVISTGHFDDKKIALLYNAASIFVYPSLYEGFGIPVLEAFACEVPVVCSNSTSLPEVAGDAAYMVDAKDPGKITEAILDIVNDPGLRNSLVKRGKERVKQFTWKKCAEETLKVYKKTLS